MVTLTKAQEIAERLGVSEAKVQSVLAHPEQVGSLMRQQSLSEEAAVFSLIADQEVLREINDVVIGSEQAGIKQDVPYRDQMLARLEGK